MQSLMIIREGEGYNIKGKTDSGRTVEIKYIAHRQAVDGLALAIDALEDQELKTLQAELDTAETVLAQVVEEKKTAEAEKEEYRQKVANYLNLFKSWSAGQDLRAGETVRFEDKVYIVREDHRTGMTSTPDIATELYKRAEARPGAAASPEDVIAGN